jgi:predicted TIM-barrel fold metal-dependent hydrolase
VLPDWQEDLRRCHEVHHMPGIRLHPSYHGYTLENPALAELLAQAQQRSLLVQLVVAMEDDRTQHPLLRVAPVNLGPLPQIAAQFPDVPLVVLNGLRTRRSEAHARLVKHRNVFFEIARLEGVGGISQLLESVPSSQILFGSHSPFYYLEAALLKLEESTLTVVQRKEISEANATRLLARRT